MYAKSTQLGWLSLIVCALVLQGCATTTPGSGVSQGERRALQLASEGRHDEAAGQYIGLASSASGGERDRLTLLAVEQWLDAGDGRRARSAMADVAPPTDPDARLVWDSNRAALLLWEGRPDAALDILRRLAAQPLSTDRRIRVETLRGDAWFQKSDPMRAVNLYLQLEQSLDDDDSVRAVRQRLWAGLLVSNPQVMRASSQFASSGIIRGWLTLGSLAVTTGRQGIGWNSGLASWQGEYPGHPAQTVLESMDVPDPGMFRYPRQVALLLPLSGERSTLGDAIQNGFFASYYRSAMALPEPQQVRLYDIVAAGSAGAAYDQAVEDGAEFVVGPLLRGSVAGIASRQALPVPVLTLNNLPDNVSAPSGLYQFALSPEDEAAAAAQRAILDGKKHGVALIPNSDWGRRLLTAFVDEFEMLGGTLLEHRYYTPTDQDFSFEIQNLMGLALSQTRYERLRANIGGSIQFDPRRRGDAEFVFVAADARVGRLLKSQLKFHYSGDLPVYATSRIYARDGRSNSDLNGVGFADTPWTIDPQAWLADLPATFNEYWPDQQSLLLSRLHAMGFDAYLLANSLYNAGSLPATQGSTGLLYIGEDGKIRRQLPWAEFENGTPRAKPADAEMELIELDGELDGVDTISLLDRPSDADLTSNVRR